MTASIFDRLQNFWAPKKAAAKKKMHEFITDFGIPALGVMVGISACIIAYYNNKSAILDAKTDLYVDFKGCYLNVRDRLSEPHPIHKFIINDCDLLAEKGLILGERSPFGHGCTIEIYENDDKWNAIKDYWHHSFDEWFAAEVLELGESLWDEYYSHAIFNALQQHKHQQVLCAMINGDSSFAGKLRQFRHEILNLYENETIISEFQYRWIDATDQDISELIKSKKKLAIQRAFLRAKDGRAGFYIPPPDCLIGEPKRDIQLYDGYPDETTKKNLLCLMDHIYSNYLPVETDILSKETTREIELPKSLFHDCQIDEYSTEEAKTPIRNIPINQDYYYTPELSMNGPRDI